MGVEIIAEAELVVIANNTQVDVEDTLGEAFRRIALVEVSVGHDQVAMGRKTRLRGFDGGFVRQLDQDVDDGFAQDAVDCRAPT